MSPTGALMLLCHPEYDNNSCMIVISKESATRIAPVIDEQSMTGALPVTLKHKNAETGESSTSHLVS